jgi:hypothetical protein
VAHHQKVFVVPKLGLLAKRHVFHRCRLDMRVAEGLLLNGTLAIWIKVGEDSRFDPLHQPNL